MVTDSSRIRILALIEASSVTGPAKNLLGFARLARTRACSGTAADVFLATFVRPHTRDNAFTAAVRDAGIPLSVLDEKRRFDISPMKQLRAVIGEIRPDIVQTHNTKSHFFVRAMKLHRKYPWVAFNHGYTATDWKDRAYNQFDRWSLPAAHRVICVCRPFAQRVEALGISPEKIRIRHNSVSPFVPPDQTAISNLRAELDTRDSRIIVCVGRLSLEKGHADLIHALSLLVQRDPAVDLKLVVVGDGAERLGLSELAGGLSLGSRVYFAGHRPDVRPFYSIAHVLALPSHSEGSPNVVLEAMAAGVPVAATAVGGVPEIITNGQTGLTVPAGDRAAMADALALLLADADLRTRLALAGHERIQESFTPEAYCDSMLEIFRDALATYTPGRP